MRSSCVKHGGHPKKILDHCQSLLTAIDATFSDTDFPVLSIESISPAVPASCNGKGIPRNEQPLTLRIIVNTMIKVRS